jgi:hypothetical protein
MDQQLEPTARPALRAVNAATATPDRAFDLDLDLDRTLLHDAASVLSARQQLDCLLAELAAQPFSQTAYRDLRAYLSGPADRAQAAYQRVCASITGREA